MDFVDQVKTLASKVPGVLGHIQTEAATRNALVEPFIRAMGYDTSNPTEVVPEFGAHLNIPGLTKDRKVDYAVLREGKPIILIECKCHTDKLNEGFKQLFHYAVATDCRIGILTNGLIYRFYADLDKPNKLDNEPFLEFDLQNLKDPLLEELRCLTKSSLDISGMLTAASDLKYVGGILQILTDQFNSPSEDFVKFFFQKLSEGKPFAGSVKPQFAAYTQRAFGQFIRDRINSVMDASGLGSGISSVRSPAPLEVATPESTDDDEAKTNENQVTTTSEELEGFYIVKSIVRSVIDSERVTHRDVASYFGILLDDNNRKPICRLYFNSPQSKRIGLFDYSTDEKQEEKIVIEKLDDIYKYTDRLKATAAHYAGNSTAVVS